MCIKIESISVHRISITKNAKNLIADTERDIRDLPHQLASVMPGDVVISTIFFQTIINAASLYGNIIFFRVALSFFPDARKQFPILKPVFTVTNPYLKVFRKRLPPVELVSCNDNDDFSKNNI